jgi:predicted amino acid racemase
VIGIGTNLTCFNGILPNQDKLIQLSLYKQLIEAKFNHKIEYVSGGSSVTIPLLLARKLPKGINHFRVGESLFLGTDVYNDSVLKNMASDVFMLQGEIIELIEKPLIPDGQIGTNVEGHLKSFDNNLDGKTSYRAIVDFGVLDVDGNHIFPIDNSYSIVGGSSDMFVVNLGENINNYKTGDLLKFKLDYMGVARILNSKYIEKVITNIR